MDEHPSTTAGGVSSDSYARIMFSESMQQVSTAPRS
jgi:hypothetical protein